VSAAPPNIRQSCCNASACKCLLTSNLQTCSEDFGMPALKTKDLSFKLSSRGVTRWVRQDLSVSGPFVCRCLNIPIMLRFHTPLIEPDRRN
jgi:hypothetical protein